MRLAGDLTVKNISNEAAALTDYTTNKTGATKNILTADGTWSVAATDMTAAIAGGVSLVGDLNVTAIATEAGVSTTYSTGNTGATNVLLTATDGNLSLIHI